MHTRDKRLETVLRHLRSNAREKITRISELSGMPTSTVHQKLNEHQGAITRHTTLVDWTRLGFHARASVVLRAHDKSTVRDALLACPHVNNAFTTVDGFIAELVCEDYAALDASINALAQAGASVTPHHLLEDVVRENVFASIPGKDGSVPSLVQKQQ